MPEWVAILVPCAPANDGAGIDIPRGMSQDPRPSRPASSRPALSSRRSREEKVTTENPELADRFNRVLSHTVEAMEEAGIRYAFIGGIASSGLGRPRSTHDIDLFVLPEDAELALRALARHGFRTEKTDPSWLYKGFKENILVDVIFRSKGEIYFDSEMHQRMTTAEYHGKRLRLIAPEDLLIIKAVAHGELTPNHWQDAIALLTHADLDWQYLLRRAKRAPRRILSLLLYAQSNDIWVPNHVIHDLYTVIFGDVVKQHQTAVERVAESRMEGRVVQLKRESRLTPMARTEYSVAHLRERIAEDLKTNELDIQVEQSGNKILLRGDVQFPERRQAIEDLAREVFPECEIENQIRIIGFTSPAEPEEVG